MHVAVEMSLYPLTGEFVPPILDFIERLKAQPGLTVVTNSMSTQVSGDYDRVFDALKAEILPSLAAPHRAVMVLKVLGGGG
ncbi:MAG TPA: YkoF family thiamine/hydroxymethylpyrimidine-binding protein [Steroidobacteraceae bacterium]|nr:YkoF family thiamine/hydroxymethylpyrimidine-binding protein [Steroidobacteraceae bacterium]